MGPVDRHTRTDKNVLTSSNLHAPGARDSKAVRGKRRFGRTDLVLGSQALAWRWLIVDLTPRAVRAIVKRTARRAAEETGVEDFDYVSAPRSPSSVCTAFARRQSDEPARGDVGRWVGLFPGH